jgi:hypothetical protein
VTNAARYYKEITMSEPRVDDDAALGKHDECDKCDCFIWECICSEPDVTYDEYYGNED